MKHLNLRMNIYLLLISRIISIFYKLIFKLNFLLIILFLNSCGDLNNDNFVEMKNYEIENDTFNDENSYNNGPLISDTLDLSPPFDEDFSLRKLDPGLWTGTWLPNGNPRHWVVDQGEKLGIGDVSQIPGCVNQKDSNTDNCYGLFIITERINGMNVTWKPLAGNIMSVRSLSPSDPERVNWINRYGRFRLASTTGGNLEAPTTISLSLEPGDFSNPNCTSDINPPSANSYIIIPPTNGREGCPIKANTLYYLNIKPKVSCVSVGCGYKLIEAF